MNTGVTTSSRSRNAHSVVRRCYPPCPVTVIGACQDFMVSPTSIELTARTYGVQPVFLDGSGHMLQSEIPPTKLAAILRSLDGRLVRMPTMP
jgi:hypothetical protein